MDREQPLTTVEGVVEEIIFSNEQNGYTVCSLASESELITLVGTMPFLMPGESVKASGTWQVHATFGRQLKVEAFEKALPADEEAIFKYLAGGAIKGIGPVTAQRIVDRYGADTFDVLENHPEYLADIRGITRKKSEELGNEFRAQFGVRNIMLFLNRFFGAALSVRIYKKYKAAAIDIVKANPYRLCAEIHGIGFEKADAVGRELGFEPVSPDRIEAGIRYVLTNEAYQSGHCYLPYTLLLRRCDETLRVPLAALEAGIALCVDKGEVVRRTIDGSEAYALLRFYGAENYIASKLKVLSEATLPYRLEGIEAQIDSLEAKYDISYDTKQRDAIRAAVTCGVSVVTGGPGTGKTTVIKAIIDLFDSLRITYQLAAPTGRAAKRMSEASGREAKTVHRMLEMVFEEDGDPVFARNGDNPLGCGAVIIDEMSMVDTLLMEALLRALPAETLLVLIGDVDQLPPVGPGNVLRDIIRSELFHVTTLDHIFRQASQSLIVVNAHRINDGQEPLLNVRDNDFFFLERRTIPEMRDLLASLCRDRLPASYNVDPFEDIQVISPTRRGEMGTQELNKLLQGVLNPKTPQKKEKRVRDIFFRENDKVMQTRNNYDLAWTKDGEDGMGIFNGDIGRITQINFREELFVIEFDGRRCEYDFALSDDLVHAYAITVHKSQGSEYPIVIFPACRCPTPLMNRNLLYTAVTRAKKLLIVAGSQGVLEKMAETERHDLRFTALLTLLEENQNA